MVHSINEAAFGRSDEGDLVHSLRIEGVVLVSLVAELGKRAVGHILFSRMSIEADGRSIAAVALAPMAVLSECQRQGVGGRLIRHGLDFYCGGRASISSSFSAIPIITRASAFQMRKHALLKARSLRRLSWQTNSAPVLWMGFTARSDTRPRSDSEKCSPWRGSSICPALTNAPDGAYNALWPDQEVFGFNAALLANSVSLQTAYCFPFRIASVNAGTT